MTSAIQNQTFGKALRLMICAALAFAITSITTQVIISSAGQHEYGIGSTRVATDATLPDMSRRITVAQAR